MTYTLEMMRRDSERTIASRTTRSWTLVRATLCAILNTRVLGNSAISALLALGIFALIIHAQITV